ncbi:MAG: carboxypeptidase regulatory-like domain-containing protein [Candidatus Cloacimonetes bacterium]|nr:carboxypeptidase regulatory-like domain-containing protein [Candidatus Cloacimonadota bacterium]
MKTKVLLFSLFVMLIIIGCDENITNMYEQSETDGRVIGSIHGIITDAVTNERLVDITITWSYQGNVENTTTDNLGYYSISDLSPGNYELTFSDTMHAIGRVNVVIPTLQQIGIDDFPTNEDFYHSEIMDVDMFPLDAALSGTIYTRSDNENINLADGVVIIADFAAYDISPAVYTTTSDGNGFFQFADIPSTADVNIRTMPFYDDPYEYQAFAQLVPLVASGTTNMGNIILDIAPFAPIIVQNNFENDDFELTASIVVTFSKMMNTDSFDILLNSAFGDVEFETSWENGITLTIDPYVPLQANTQYNLILEGNSLDNNDFDGNYIFTTQEGIEFIQTNLERVDGVFDQFPIASNIEIEFSMTVDLNNYDGYIRLRDEDNNIVATTNSLSGDSMTLIIDPLYDLESGQDYSLDFRVYSEIEGDFAEDEDIIDPLEFTTVEEINIPTQVTDFMVDMGEDWVADWNTTLINFRWDTQSNVDQYAIYARDNYNNTDFIEVGVFNADDFVYEQTGNINLGNFPQFDYFLADGVQSPFTNGTQLTFNIAAINVAGYGAFSDAVTISDESAPGLQNVMIQNGTADNFGNDDSATFTVRFDADEYLSSSTPAYFIVEAGGDDEYVIPGSAVSFEWDDDMRGGLFTITVPADEDGSGDEFRISFTDSSGNETEDEFIIVLF